MTWDELFSNWPAQVERLLDRFPHADRAALTRFRGNRQHLAQYIADAHDLTPSEGLEAIEMRLLPGARVDNRVARLPVSAPRQMELAKAS